MGLPDAFRGVSVGIDYSRVRIGMDFSVRWGIGDAAVQWQTIAPCPGLSEQRACVALVGLHYGRILLAHKETRAELFGRVGRAAQHVLDGGALEFGKWELEAGGKSFTIWPWTYHSAEVLYSQYKPKTYVATMRGNGSQMVIDLKMAWGLERVLAPSSVLLALDALYKTISPDDQLLLAKVLSSMNTYYGDPSGSARQRSEVKAVDAALSLLMG